MATEPDRPLLTLNQVKDMRAEMERILQQIDDLALRKSLLERKLAAAAEFMGNAEKPITLTPRVANGSADLGPMTDAVVAIVSESGPHLTLKQVRKRLAEAGYPKKRLGNYFYTVMRRLTEHRRIVREGDYFMTPRRDPETSETSEAPNEHGH